ncbi:DUF58 domain-containing protein [Gemmata sp. JC673]|uniref:DUF58 domain-containing protein n=1 Tax=Gemmata algarum TaxID=2975278 RepID=A0ABU5EWQ7_9BACT|nr:DUF58 domain-containing protein [Gemmata algarum]MDY3559565.1 DUF58 domain-containing protein [Gemmata algarum]
MTGTLEPATLDARQFQIAVRKLADSLGYGTDRSPYLGSGTEYVQSRLYQPGDPVRSIDWRITARTGRAFVKEYETPKRMPCYLVVDTSASMAVSSIRRSKYEVAVHLAGGLALASLDRASPVGLVGGGGRDLQIAPSLAPDKVWVWLHQLRKVRYDEPTAVGRRLRELAPRLNERALLVVLSDFHDPEAVPALRLLGQRHECVALHLTDPAEVGLRGTGLVRAREAETGRRLVSHGRRVWSDPASVATELRRAGVDHLSVPTDQPFVAEVRQFFATRGRLGRGAR